MPPQLDPVDYEKEGLLEEIRRTRGYNYMDELECSPDKLDNYCEKLQMFFKEHIHSDEEIRYETLTTLTSRRCLKPD